MNQYIIYDDTYTSVKITTQNVNNLTIKVNDQIINIQDNAVRQIPIQDNTVQQIRVPDKKDDTFSPFLLVTSLVCLGLITYYLLKN